MSPDNAPSFYDWNQSFKKKPETKNERINTPISFDSFITIFPAWELKRKYALIRINKRTFKLFERGNRNVEKVIEALLSVFLYLNPSGYNERMQKIHNQVYENKKDFKEKWDSKLEVYKK